ncbi:MAG TPA: hypothetical protein DEA08_36470 [Planctomycetes bacterium]|nr:hypothetical protein [Planctomycetota bacterium]
MATNAHADADASCAELVGSFDADGIPHARARLVDPDFVSVRDGQLFVCSSEQDEASEPTDRSERARELVQRLVTWSRHGL